MLLYATPYIKRMDVFRVIKVRSTFSLEYKLGHRLMRALAAYVLKIIKLLTVKNLYFLSGLDSVQIAKSNAMLMESFR